MRGGELRWGRGQGKASVAGQSSSLYLYVAAGEWAREDLASAWSGVSGTSLVRVDGGKMIIMHVPQCWVYSSRWRRRGPWRPDAYRNAEMSQRMWLGRVVCVRRPHPRGVLVDLGTWVREVPPLSWPPSLLPGHLLLLCPHNGSSGRYLLVLSSSYLSENRRMFARLVTAQSPAP